MQDRNLFVRFLVVVISLVLFLLSFAGLFLVYQDYADRSDAGEKTSVYDRLTDESQGYYDSLFGR